MLSSEPPARHFRYALGGFGPAACGFLLHAMKRGVLRDMARDGLVVIERSTAIGRGRLGDYRLTGNSLGVAFLDCIDDPDLKPLFDDLRFREPAFVAMRALRDAAPSLELAADFVAAMATRLHERLADYQVPVLRAHAVERIVRRAEGGYALQIHARRHDLRQRITTDKLIGAFGGRQDLAQVLQAELLPGMTLAPWRERLLLSDDFLRLSDEAIRDRWAGARTLAVLGGSHSAFSSIDRLAQALGPVGLREIVVIHRAPIRLYYASRAEARRDHYRFADPDDVCPLSGRVNRAGGLRYRAFDVARAILATGQTPDQPVEVRFLSLTADDRGLEARLRQILDAVPAVACFGYQANFPPLSDEAGRTIALRNGEFGLEVDAAGRVLTLAGVPLPGLFAFGLGSRLLKRSERIGGEPSFERTSDGVWLYQFHGGELLMDALMAETTGDELQLAAAAAAAGATRGAAA